MRSAIFLVTALVAASTATPWGSRANQQCASYCKETSKFRYSVGTIYSYDYTGETASKIGGTSEQESRLHISAQADFEVVSQCELVLRLKRVVLEQSDPLDGSARSIASGSANFAAGLEQQPLVFSFQDGQIEHLCPSVDESEWALNVKRGILSAMQNSMLDLATSQLVFETDVVGHCETNYTVESQARTGVTVSRSKDLLACTGRNSQHTSPILSTPYSSASSIQSLPLLRSENECQQTIRNQLLEKSVCTETHLFRPFSNSQSGASTRITQTLTYSSERRSDQVPIECKKKKASLLFVGPDSKKTTGSSLTVIDETLNLLAKESPTGISPKTPALFARLVNALRPLTYVQLTELFGKTHDTKAKKYLMDAAPLVGTAASYGLMRDIIQEGLLSDLEVDMWLASLAFQPKPTLAMITAVSPMLVENPVRPKALLSISALIHAYCRNHPSGCQSEEAIKQAVLHIENRIGIACRYRDQEEQKTILLALKALGNAGLVVSSTETLKKCYQEETNSMVIRMAAIDALRRVPCHLDGRDSLLSFYRDTKHDSELRIGAYLAAMQCPSAQLLEEVKQTLINENVNQVGSFVWTHLTNLQETSSPSKQAVRQLLSTEFLRNKFNTDARKFSRNLEVSSYWQDLNVGGTVESNVIFSSQSYLPRSANLNLTLDLFGESVNLLELGARLEGFESLVESFFGPGGLFPDDTIQKVLENLRGKRAAPVDEQSLNQLSTIFDAKGQVADQPQGDLYLRVFGNELHTHHFKGLEQLMGKQSQSPLAMLLQAAGQKDIDFSKSVSVMDVSYVLPTAIGLPLSLTVNATATVAFKMGGTFQTGSLSDVKITGHVKPSGTMEINGLMTVDAWTFGRSGVHVQNSMHTSTGLSGKMIIQGSKLVSVQLDAPEEATNTFSFDSRLFLIQENGPKAVQPDQRARFSQKSCSPTWLSRTFGAELCGELDFYPSTKTGPSGPLTGPAHAAIFLRKTDKHHSYRFEYKREGFRAVSLIMDTPDSAVNRRLSAQLTLDELANSLRASFICPQKSFEVTGKYEYNQLLKGADVMLTVDGAELASIRTALRTDLKGASGRYEPSLLISQRGREVLNFQGYFSYVAVSKYGFDFQLKHLTVRPIRLTGDISKDNDNKHELSLGLKSYLLDATLASTTRLSEKLTTSKTRIGYSIMEGTSQSLEFSGKYNRAIKGLLKKTTLAGTLQSSQFPQYNGDLSWDLQQSENYLENNIRLNTGVDQWEIHQLYSVQHRDFNVRFGVVCKQQKIDWLIYTTFQNTDTTFTSQSALRLSPGRQWSGKLDLVRQDYQPGRRYGGRVEVSTPTTNRHLSAEVRQEEENQWDLAVEYSMNQKVEASLMAVYKNSSTGIRCQHLVEVRLRSWAAEDLDLDGLFIASPTNSIFSVNGRYGEQKASSSVEYDHRNQLEHSVSARIISGDDTPVFTASFNINAGNRKSLAFDIMAGRRVTLDAQLSSKMANVQLFWDRDEDLSRSFEFSGQLSATGGDAQFKCAGKPSVRLNVDKIGKDLKIQLEWRDNQVVTLRLEHLPTRTAGLLTTPFAGFRRITFDGVHKCSKSSIDTQLTIDWQKDRFTLSMMGNKTAENVEGAVKLTSTFNQLENLGAEFQALSSLPVHRYSLAVQHLGRRAQLSTDFHRVAMAFKSASVNLATPVYGYEALEVSVGHNQQPGNFQTGLKIEGPFSSRVVVTVSGKTEKSETTGNLAVTTNFSVLETFITSFQLYNAKQEKKLSVSGELNGQQATARASANILDRELRGDLQITSPFSDDLTAYLNHRFDGHRLQSVGTFSWANDKNVKIILDGQLAYGKTLMNASLSTPNWMASARLDHKKIAGKMDTIAEMEFDGKRATWTLNAQNLQSDNLRMETTFTAPFRDFEDLRFTLEHRQDGRKTLTKMQAARKENGIVLEHDVEYFNLFNWANRLSIKTPFAGLSSLTVNSKQSWASNQLEHDGQLQLNGKSVTVCLKADKSRPGMFTASGSLATSWSEDVVFDLKHSDDGVEFRPLLIIRTGNGQPIRLETAYRRGPINPSLIVEIVSPLSDPLKLSAAYLNESPVQTAKLSLNWNGDRTIDWTLDWALTAFKSSIKTRLSTPFSRYSNVEAETVYDVTGLRKTGTILLRRDGQTIMLDAFAAGQGSGYQAEMVLSSPFYETVKTSAQLDLAGARASIKLDRGKSQIHLHGFLTVAPTQTGVTATLETPFSALRVVKIESVLKSSRELQLDIDFDGQKVSLTGAHSAGPAKGTLRASLKTPFIQLRSGSVDASYDASSPAKTASLTLSRNQHVIQASAQITLIGPVKLAINLRAPCCGIHHLDVTGSYDESVERKSGHLKLDLNGEKYQLDGHLMRSNGTAEVALKSQTGYQGYEQVVLNAKYDVRQPAKTGSITFSKNQDRFHVAGTASTRSVVMDLTTPIGFLRSVRVEGFLNSETATLTIIRNEEAIKLTAGGSVSSLQGKLDCGLETPYSGYENFRAELVYDLSAPRKLIVLDAGKIRAEMEFNGRRLTIRSTTPIVGYEQLELVGDYALDSRELLAGIFMKRNGNIMESRLSGLFDPESKEASFEFQSPIPFVRILSSKLTWNVDPNGSRSFNLQSARNEMTTELEMSGRFFLDNSALNLAGRSNIEGWNSASLSAVYDVRNTISASLNIEKNGVQQSFAGEAKFDQESAVLAVQTPFEGMRTMGLAGRLVDASKVNISSDRSATLHFEREGLSQDYGLSLSFDANSAALSIETPFQNYEKMSAKVRFELDKPQKVFHLVVKKNHHQMELNGQAKAGEAELKLTTTLAGLENAMAAGRYDFSSSAKLLSLKFSLNGKMIEMNGSLEGMKVDVDIVTPFVNYEQIKLNGDVQLTAKTSRLMVELGGKRYEVTGSLTDRRLIVQLKTPLAGFEVTDFSARWNDRQIDLGLTSPSLGKMILSAEYDLGKSLQFGRLVMTHNGFRYRNELVAKLMEPWMNGEILLGVQLPFDGLRNMTSTLTYDLVSSEKSLIMTLDNSVQHYETAARVSITEEAGLATLHVQTPVPSWEEIDLNAGYDLMKKTVFVLSERNGQSMLFVQGLATLSTMSSIVSGTVRVPAFLTEDIEMMAAYNLAAESADAKIKYCAHEILFDGKRTQDWASVMATLSTSFEELQTAQINWNGVKKTASLHFNNMKATLDGRVQNIQDVGVKATLSAPSLGTHTVETEWNLLSNKFTSRAEYKNGQNRRFGVNSSINFSVEKGDYQLTVHTGKAGLEDVQLVGSWSCNDKIKSESALHWSGVKNIEAIFDGQFTALRSVARLHLVAPHIRPVKTEIQYDLTSTEKSFRLDYNSIVQLNSLVAVKSMIDWNGKIDLVINSEKYSATSKLQMEPSAQLKEFLIRLESTDMSASQFRVTMENKNQRVVVNASLYGPSLENELKFQGHCDTSSGLNSSGTFSWTKEKNVRANVLMTPSELSAELMTPFSGLETTRLSVKYNLGQQKQTMDTTFVWAGRTLTGSANWQLEDGIVFSVRFTTPFQGFEQVGLRGSFLSGSDYTTTLSYSRAGKQVDIQGKLTSNAAGSVARITFAGENEQLSAVVEYDVRQPKKTASLTLSRGVNQRISVTAAGEFADKINGILSIETSSSLPIRLSLDMDPNAAEKNGRLTLEWGQQQKLELMGGWTSNKAGSKFRLAAQTPFEGFKKILVNSRMNQKVFDCSVEYGRNRKVQLNGQYRWDQKLSVYSVNGTLATPWLDHILSGQSYVDMSNGFHGSVSVVPAAQKTYSFITTYRPSGSYEASVQTPCDSIRSAKLSGAYETDSRRMTKRLAAGVEFNGREASIEGRLTGQNGRNVSIKGSWNNQVMTVETFFQNDFPTVKMAANVTTPFQGYKNWAARFERTKKAQQCDLTLHLTTPLASIPSVDASIQTILDAGKRLEIGTSLSALGHTGRARLQLAKNIKTYTASLELDVPFIQVLRSVNVRAECQIDGWKNVVSTVTAGVPAGEYTVKGSMLIGKSSLNLNAGIKTPSFAKSIEMGAGYNAANLDLVQGEIFVWDNKLEGRYEKRGNQISVELSFNLPDLKLAHNRLNFEMNYRSPRQLQSSVSIITLQRTHTVSLAYQLAGNKFTGQLDVDSPVFQSKKTLSVKINYGSLSAMTFDGRFVDGQNTCELTGSLRLMGESVHGQAKLTCAMFGTVAIEVTGSPSEGKLTITTGPSTHRLGYKLNLSNGGYDITIDAQSPSIQPLHVRGIWMLGDVQQGQASLTIRYGDSAHSVLGDYLRSGGDKTAASFSLASPFLPGGQASIQLQYQPFDLNVQLDMLGQSHRLTGLLQRWPALSGRIQLDSPVLPWKTMALHAQAERNVRDFLHGQANITASYGEQSLGLAGQFRYAQWSDFEGWMELNTPFQGLTMARADFQLSAINAQRVNASINFQSSHVVLPRASFNVQYQLGRTVLDASATLNTPFSRWETVGLAVSIPLAYENAKALVSLSLPGTQYSASGLLAIGRRQFRTEIEVDYAGRKFATQVLFKADEIYQAKIDVKTPIRGFENYSWDVKGQANVRRWGEATAFLDWNGKRIEFSSNVKVEPLAYIAVVQLNTPFVDFERYAVRLRLEGTDRKTLQVEVESPGMRVGADFDYVFNSATDFVGKASIRTPLAGYESFTLHLSNQLGTSSYSANAEARFADYGLAASIEGLIREGGFQAQMDGRYNDRVIVLKAGGSLDEKRVTCNVNLVTPYEEFKSLESFVQLEKDLAESKGFGLSVNGRQLILVSLAKQSDGLQVLQIKNPWRPVDFSYSLEHSSDLIHYHAQLCWDLNRRSSATFGGRLIVKTSSYGRQISVKTVTPRREWSLDYALELTSSKVDHSIKLSWAADKTAGYRILAENGSTRRQTKLGGSVRLDLPARSFQLESQHVGGETTSTNVDFHWDAARDSSKRLGARLETRHGRQVRLVFLHPELERDIVLQGEYDRLNENELTGKVELIYSPLEEHLLVIKGSTTGQETGRAIQLVILHPASNTDLRLVADGKKSSGTELQARLDYKDRSKTSRFLQLGAKILPEQRRIDLEARTAEKSLTLTNALTLSGSAYALASRTLVNDAEALIVDARLETSSSRPVLEIDGSYAGGKSFNFLAGMPDRREITVRAVRDIHGRKITDGLFQVKLNQTDLLFSRVYWRSASRAELRDAAVSGLINVLAACESFADDLANFVASEWIDKRSTLTPTARLITQRLTDSMIRELDTFRSEFNQMAVELAAMYERNDFYLQNIVSTLKQVASLAQPFFDRTMANIEAISRAVIGESTAFYRAAVSTYNSLAQMAFSGYQQLSSYVSSGVSEVARYYSQLAGEVMSRILRCESVIVQAFQRLQSLFHAYAGRLETVVMEQVEGIRVQLIELAASYAESFRPYTQYFDQYLEAARVFYAEIMENFQDMHQMIHDRLLTYAPFQRLYAVYLEYATWLEEFHIHDYVDDCINYFKQVKQEIRDRIDIITARYQPLIDPVVQAFQGQMDALKQLPVVIYINTVVENVSRQINEFSKYVELEAKLRQILRDALQHTDRLTTQLMKDLKGSLAFPMKPEIVIDWESGRLEYSQRLPFTWENFGQLPRLRELPLLRKMATAKRNLIREMDYSQLYFSAMNALAIYKPMTIQSILPPFGSRAFVAGTQHYMTFDRRFYEFAGECSYLLASDFFRNDFSAVVNYEGAGGKVTRKSITILSDGRQVEIDSTFRVTLNGRKIEMPLVYETTSIQRDGQRLIVTNTKSGFRVDCNLYRDICSVHVSGWSFGKTGGLFGVYNNEPADDFLTPFRQQRTDEEVDSFANSWKVGTSRCRVRNFAVTRPAPSARNSRLCDQLFSDEQSVLRPCFQMVDPAPFARMCLNDLATLENSPKKDLGVCTAASAYANECRFAGLDLFVPPQCVRCELEDGKVMGSGEIKTFQNDAPRSADVVFIVDQKPCLNGTRLSYLPAAIDAALKERGIQQNRFAVVGYGGRGDKLFQKPHVRTTDGGQIWSHRKGIQLALEDLPLAEQQSAAPSDIHAALRYAINLPYRVGVSKQFVLVSCGGSECQASSYADALTLLIENDVKLHLLQPRDIIVKGRNSSEELKNVFGFDAEEVYTVRNVRSLKGDRELRRQLAMPKDFCTPLALETNGTLFDLKKMMPGQQQQQTKKFVDIFARRVAATGEPSPCQRCDCIGDRDGIGSILCQRCVSPVMERLDKVWEQLVYENEMENAANVEEVTVAQIRESLLDPMDKASRLALPTTPLQ